MTWAGQFLVPGHQPHRAEIGNGADVAIERIDDAALIRRVACHRLEEQEFRQADAVLDQADEILARDDLAAHDRVHVGDDALHLADARLAQPTDRVGGT
ncbi:hypothetical protein [Breoghania sp.]|uniref:hypothetical protein n=1 Tax=Breoghania sp. TaxID=2065378 RepID=UPI00262710A6|nr:hypothetical protein [Breoghania sp.]